MSEINSSQPLTAEDRARLIGMAAAAKLMRGRGGRCPHVDSVRRWANQKKGCHPAGLDGPRLVLRTVRSCGELVTLPEWVEAFEAARLREANRKPEPLNLGRSPARREAAYRRAEAALDKAGVGTRKSPPPA